MRFAIITSLFLARCSRSSNSGFGQRGSLFELACATEFWHSSGKSEQRVPNLVQKLTFPYSATRAPTGPHTWLLSFHSFLPLCLPYFVQFLRARDRASLFEESKKDRQWRSMALGCDRISGTRSTISSRIWNIREFLALKEFIVSNCIRSYKQVSVFYVYITRTGKDKLLFVSN